MHSAKRGNEGNWLGTRVNRNRERGCREWLAMIKMFQAIAPLIASECPTEQTAQPSPPKSNRMRRTRSLANPGSLLAALAMFLVCAPRADANADEFEGRIRPMIQKYCVSCHGVKRPKAGINLTKFQDATA